MYNKKEIILAFIFVVGFTSIRAKAIDMDIGAEADFVAVLSLSNNADMDYGLIEYSGVGANNVDISSSTATIFCSDTVNYNCPKKGTRASIEIGATKGYTVDISCESNGVIANGTDALNLINTEFTIDGNTSSCNGLGIAPKSHVMTGVTVDDTVYFGARIVIPATGIKSSGNYNTSTGTGSPIIVKVVYQ